MGAPKRNRRKYDKPKEMWNHERINADSALTTEYGLKSTKELWKVQTEVSRLRRNVRMLLSGNSTQSTLVQERLVGRLAKYGIANTSSTLDSLLDLNENAFLSRRLQTVVFKKGLAKTMKQARQLITHGFISINGVRVNRPSYLVSTDEEVRIGYYKPIEIGVAPKREAPATPEDAVATEPAKGDSEGA